MYYQAVLSGILMSLRPCRDDSMYCLTLTDQYCCFLSTAIDFGHYRCYDGEQEAAADPLVYST